ncbi:MAG: MinD/ParA family protein [Spirochaetaceae bacterium]|nr:MAG: MinD/ParA family protein [Spirochaetaceae bacterium]
MTHIIPVASGKGGVGKTVFSANIGISLAREGKTVVLVDLDLGGANLHTVLGVRNNRAGVGNLIFKQEQSLASLVAPTDYDRVFFIPGDSLLPGTANLPYFQKLKILKELPALVADFVILDLGSGSSYNTVDFFLASSTGIIVTTPETTAILNAYSFLKTVLYRTLLRSFPARSDERRIVHEFSTTRIEGSATTFSALADRLDDVSPESAETARKVLSDFRPRVILNQGRSQDDIAIGARLRNVVERNMGTSLEYIGYVPYDPDVARAVIERRPTCASRPDSMYAQILRTIARKVIHAPVADAPKLFPGNEDLEALAAEHNAILKQR